MAISNSALYKCLTTMTSRPEPYCHYTTVEMWNDEHISAYMLAAHLDENSDRASRSKGFIRRSAKWMKEYFTLSPATEIIDFGCGPGLYTSKWAHMDAHVTGIDVSARSIEYAKSQAQKPNLPIQYIRANYLNYLFSGYYDLITMIFCDYCVLNPLQRRRLLSKWKSILQPNGYILFDVSSLAYFDSVAEARSYEYEREGGFWSPQPYHVFHSVYRYDSDRLLLDQYAVIEPDRIRTYYNWLQCFSLETIRLELQQAGFRIKESFGNVAGDALTEDSTEIALVVQKAT